MNNRIYLEFFYSTTLNNNFHKDMFTVYLIYIYIHVHTYTKQYVSKTSLWGYTVLWSTAAVPTYDPKRKRVNSKFRSKMHVKIRRVTWYIAHVW